MWIHLELRSAAKRWNSQPQPSLSEYEQKSHISRPPRIVQKHFQRVSIQSMSECERVRVRERVWLTECQRRERMKKKKHLRHANGLLLTQPHSIRVEFYTKSLNGIAYFEDNSHHDTTYSFDELTTMKQKCSFSKHLRLWLKPFIRIEECLLGSAGIDWS